MNNNNGNNVNRRGRTPEQENAFLRFMIAFLGTITNQFSLINPLTTILGPFLIRLNVNDIHEYNLRRRCSPRQSRDFQWKAWIVTFRALILEIRIMIVFQNRRITLTFEQFVQVAWLLNKYVLQENEVSPTAGQQCRYCCMIGNANCQMQPCRHFVCLDCAYSMRELVIHNCNCGSIINQVIYYTMDNLHRFATTTVRRILSFQRLLKAIMIPVTMNFRHLQS